MNRFLQRMLECMSAFLLLIPYAGLQASEVWESSSSHLDHPLLQVAQVDPLMLLWAEAERDFREGRYHEAISKYETWLKRFPGHAQVLYNQGRAYQLNAEPWQAAYNFAALTTASSDSRGSADDWKKPSPELQGDAWERLRELCQAMERGKNREAAPESELPILNWLKACQAWGRGDHGAVTRFAALASQGPSEILQREVQRLQLDQVKQWLDQVSQPDGSWEAQLRVTADNLRLIQQAETVLKAVKQQKPTNSEQVRVLEAQLLSLRRTEEARRTDLTSRLAYNQNLERESLPKWRKELQQAREDIASCREGAAFKTLNTQDQRLKNELQQPDRLTPQVLSALELQARQVVESLESLQQKKNQGAFTSLSCNVPLLSPARATTFSVGAVALGGVVNLLAIPVHTQFLGATTAEERDSTQMRGRMLTGASYGLMGVGALGVLGSWGWTRWRLGPEQLWSSSTASFKLDDGAPVVLKTLKWAPSPVGLGVGLMANF